MNVPTFASGATTGDATRRRRNTSARHADVIGDLPELLDDQGLDKMVAAHDCVERRRFASIGLAAESLSRLQRRTANPRQMSAFPVAFR
jgi:hypothetical protein